MGLGVDFFSILRKISYTSWIEGNLLILEKAHPLFPYFFFQLSDLDPSLKEK